MIGAISIRKESGTTYTSHGGHNIVTGGHRYRPECRSYNAYDGDDVVL